jgi:hypothetical protein
MGPLIIASAIVDIGANFPTIAFPRIEEVYSEGHAFGAPLRLQSPSDAPSPGAFAFELLH